MVGTLTVTIVGHTTISGAVVNFSLNFNLTVADSATAQTVVTGVKAFLTGAGATIDSVTGTFTQQAASLS